MAKFSSINGAPEEPVSHNPAAQKPVWFCKRDLPSFTQIARVAIPAGQTLESHAHADMHELFLVLDGKGRMFGDGITHQLGPGDAVALAPGEKHELANSGATRLEFLVAGWTNCDRQ